MSIKSKSTIAIIPVLFAIATLFLAVAPPSGHAQAKAQVPRMVNGKPDFTGIWEHSNVGNLAANSDVCGGFSSAAGLDLSRPGCKNIGAGPLPYSEAGLAAKKAMAGVQQGEHCVPWGFVHLFGTPFPHGYVQSPERMIMVFEQDNAFMMVPTDGRELPKDLDPTWRGTSVGRWEGETLVVETAGFNGISLLSGSDVNSDAMKVTQRMSYIDANHILDEITMDDSKYYTKPFKNVRTFQRMKKGEEIYEYFCHENNRCENGKCTPSDVQK